MLRAIEAFAKKHSRPEERDKAVQNVRKTEEGKRNERLIEIIEKEERELD